MFVLCPHCQFLVALDSASGQPPLRCPRCEEWLRTPVVDSAPADELVSAQAPEPEPAQPATEQMAPVDALAEENERSQPQNDADFAAAVEPIDPGSKPVVAEVSALPESNAQADAPAAADTTPLPEASPTTRKRAPSFVRAPAHETTVATRNRWRLPASILSLVLLLLLQIVLADRAQLSADAHWRPALSTLCSALRCSLPPWREPGAFTLLDRDVRPHPQVSGVLRVTASFRNDARWSQPLPSLLLTLSDVDGRVAGTRLFAPREYLGGTATQTGLASGQSASIVMDVREPAPRVVAFTFDFR
jgi:hypothetical protein